MSAERVDSSVSVTWETTFETGCASFELWSDLTRGSQPGPTLLTTIPAERAEGGASYAFIDNEPLTTFSFDYTIVAVADDGNKYPCKRVSVPAIEL